MGSCSVFLCSSLSNRNQWNPKTTTSHLASTRKTSRDQEHKKTTVYYNWAFGRFGALLDGTSAAVRKRPNTVAEALQAQSTTGRRPFTPMRAQHNRWSVHWATIWPCLICSSQRCRMMIVSMLCVRLPSALFWFHVNVLINPGIGESNTWCMNAWTVTTVIICSSMSTKKRCLTQKCCIVAWLHMESAALLRCHGIGRWRWGLGDTVSHGLLTGQWQNRETSVLKSVCTCLKVKVLHLHWAGQQKEVLSVVKPTGRSVRWPWTWPNILRTNINTT